MFFAHTHTHTIHTRKIKFIKSIDFVFDWVERICRKMRASITVSKTKWKKKKFWNEFSLLDKSVSARLRDYFLRIRPNIQRRRRISNCTYVLVVPSNGLVCDVFSPHRIAIRTGKIALSKWWLLFRLSELCDISSHI